LLDNILTGWKELSKVLLVLLPLLAEKGHASFDDISFLLAGNFGEKPEERLRSILIEIPANVTAWYSDDIYSQKMAPLLTEKIEKEEDSLKKHELVLLLILNRPRGWVQTLEKYIFGAHKNSFYLFDVMKHLRYEYEYSFAGNREISEMTHLIKMSAAKHSFGTKKPGQKAIKRIPDDYLPDRNDPS